MTLPAKLRRLAGFDLKQWSALILTQWLLPRIARGLRRRGLKDTLRWVERSGLAGGRRADGTLAEVRAVAAAVNASSRYGLFRGACLQRSLVLSYLLHRRGTPHELVIGADLNEKGFNAHAWVECEGQVINDEPDVRERFGVLEANDG
jgi:hypothetical protein